MRKGVIAAGVLVLAAGAAAALYSRSRSENDKPWKLVEVTRGPVVEKALAVGAIRPKREISVKSKISGIVRRAFREVGDHVERRRSPFRDPARPHAAGADGGAARGGDRAGTSTSRRRSGPDRRLLAQQAGHRLEPGQRPGGQGNPGRTDPPRPRPRSGSPWSGRGACAPPPLNVESIIRAPVSGTVLELLVNEGDPVVPLTSFQAGTALTTLADMSQLIFKGTSVLGPGGGELRHRRLLRLPRPAPADDVLREPLRGLRDPAARRPAQPRQPRHAVPPDARSRAGHPLGGVRRRRPHGRRDLGGAAHRGSGCGADGGPAHPAGDADQPRDAARPADRRERLEGPDPGAGQRPGPAGAPARRAGATRRWASSRTSRTTSPSSTTRRPQPRCWSRSRWSPGCSGSSATSRPQGQAKLAEIAAQIEDSAEVRDVVTGLEQQYDAFHRPDADDDACRWPRSRTCRRGRSSARSSSGSWRVSTGPTTPESRPARAQVRRRARRAPRPGDHRHEPLPGHPAGHHAAAGVRWPGGRPVAGGRCAHRRAAAVGALAAQLLPAARRHRRARSCTTSSGCATGARSRPAAWWPVSTAGRSTS